MIGGNDESKDKENTKILLKEIMMDSMSFLEPDLADFIGNAAAILQIFPYVISPSLMPDW